MKLSLILRKPFLLPALLWLVAFGGAQAAAGVDDEVRHLQQRWAEVNYQLEGKTQFTAF
jgi:hypothetical protein